MAEENINAEQNNSNTPTVEELMEQLAQERANSAKNKLALDKALKQNGELTKSLRSKQTVEEQEESERKERDEKTSAYIKELETYKKMSEAKARYALLGMDAEMAEKASKAELEGNMDALAQIHKQHTESVVANAQKDWIKSRPSVASGTGQSEKDEDPFLKGFNS